MPIVRAASARAATTMRGMGAFDGQLSVHAMQAVHL